MWPLQTKKAFADWSNVTMKVLEKTENEEEKPLQSTKDNLTYLKAKYAQSRSN